VNTKVYLFLGQGGYTFSGGFSSFGDRIASLGYEVQKFPDSGRNLNAVYQDVREQPIERKIAFFGYSLGANACAWNAKTLHDYFPQRRIDLVVGWDATIYSSLDGYPIGRNVKRCLCFQNASWFGLSSIFGFGHNVYTRTADGPAIETTKVYTDHLLIQSRKDLQDIALAALSRA
jgi:hypothetical protein